MSATGHDYYRVEPGKITKLDDSKWAQDIQAVNTLIAARTSVSSKQALDNMRCLSRRVK